MLTIKHYTGLLLATTAFACSSAVMAAYLPKDDDKEAIYQIGVQGNFLWQSNNTAEYDAQGGINTGKGLEGLLPLVNEDVDGEWGGGVDVAYIFPSHKNDIRASYFFLRSDDSVAGATIYSSGGALSAAADPSAATHADLDMDFDSADIIVGTYFKPSKNWLVRLGYGLGFVRIDQQSSSEFDAVSKYGTSINDTYSENRFIGLGPKITFDGDYRMFKDLYFVGEFGFSALYGKAKTVLDVAGITDNNGNFAVRPVQYKEEDYQAALGFEGKVGLAYAAAVHEDAVLRLEGGFTAQSYVGALQDDEVDVYLDGSGYVNTVTYDGTYSNFGPYVNLSVYFMM